MAIKYPQTKSLKELLTQDWHYKIPLYQRPYAWGEDEVSKLWNDIYKNKPGYFLGIVLFQSPQNQKDHPTDELHVVDGQQRLGTLLLMLRAAVCILEKHDHKDLADKFQERYIIQSDPGEEEKSRLTLTLSKRDKEKWQSILSGQPLEEQRRYISWNNLEKSFQYFCNEFEKLIDNEKDIGVKRFITEKILQTSFIDVRLETESDVYQFFETLNDRGMALTIADLLKNKICAEVVKEAEEQGKSEREYTESIEESVGLVDNISEKAGDFKNFLLHYCLANSKKDEPTPIKDLMDWYNEHISSVADVKKFLRHLDLHASFYETFSNPSKCEKREKDKKRVFQFLDALNATRCYAVLLSGAENLKNKKEFLKLCRAVEILTFRHSTILKRDGKTLEGVFFRMIKKIRNGRSINEVLTDLKKQEAMKSDDLFKIAFAQYVTNNNKVGRYILWKLEEKNAGQEQLGFDWDEPTVEHILAKKFNWEGRDDFVERVGNLTLLSEPLNKKASNISFSEKRGVYERDERVKMTRELCKYSNFTKETIIERQKEWAELAIKIWSVKNIR